MHEKHNIIIMGASGAGKIYMGCALGNAACRNLFTTKYIRLPELLADLAIARDVPFWGLLSDQPSEQNLYFMSSMSVPLKFSSMDSDLANRPHSAFITYYLILNIGVYYI
jgi:DNA replication protein DnaC